MMQVTEVRIQFTELLTAEMRAAAIDDLREYMECQCLITAETVEVEPLPEVPDVQAES
jgi:hypothetical protein